MTDIEHPPVDPRWGQEGRDRKAEAILATLLLHCKRDLTRGVWLDIGCGSGGIAATLAEHVEGVIGIDPEPWNRWQTFRSQHSNLHFHVGSYRDLEALLKTGSCDVVICNQVYEHVDDPAALLASIHSVLKQDGICYFAGPNLLWPIEPHVFWPFVHWLPRTAAQRAMRALGSKQAHSLDAWSWSYWKLMRYIRAAGFSPVSVLSERLQAGLAERSVVARSLVAGVPRLLFKILAPIAPGFVFVLRKGGAQLCDDTQSRIHTR